MSRLQNFTEFIEQDNIESKIIRAPDELCVYVFIDKYGIGAGTMILSNKDT